MSTLAPYPCRGEPYESQLSADVAAFVSRKADRNEPTELHICAELHWHWRYLEDLT